MSKIKLLAAVAAGALMATSAMAQDHQGHDGHTVPPADPAPTPAPSTLMQDHSAHQGHRPAEDHSQHQGHGTSEASSRTDPSAWPAYGTGSGTARLPGADGRMTGVHLTSGDWMVMAHGYAWAAYTDQSGPRGDDMAFAQSMAMITADRDFGGAKLQLRSMLSLEPLMGAGGYPNLFATGETANGQSLVDRQHPHDLFMELAARVDIPVSENASLFLYGGPVAEPALGPSAFMHRRSSRYLPQAPITHHWFDSTHITYGVITAGYASSLFQIEGSAFRGREPDESRWDIETPKLDSWSVRATLTPTPNWALQVSHGRLKDPEALHPGQDEARTTASVQYSDAKLSGLVAFSAKNRIPGQTLTAWLAEANWNPVGGHNLFGRIENVANDELFPDHSDPLHDTAFRVTRFEAGYAHRFRLTKDVNLALGGSVATFAKPAALDSAYGRAPFAYTLFARLSLGD